MRHKGRKMSENTILINFKKGELNNITPFFVVDIDLTTMKERERERPRNKGSFQK